MPDGIPLVTVDAFTGRPYSGNPAGVCVLDHPGDGRWMQLVAAELNLSETAFLYPDGDAWSIRWFSPAVEVPLCGHATLASAHVLWETGRVAPDARIAFDSMSGPLGAWREGELIGLNFPSTPATAVPPDPALAAALGGTVTALHATGALRVAEVATDEELVALKPDFAALARLDAMVFAVTAPGHAGVDYACRVFGPKVGINEDPVTGSIQCALGPLWAARLGKTELTVRQRSARGGEMTVRVAGDRVHILGRAVTIMTGLLKN